MTDAHLASVTNQHSVPNFCLFAVVASSINLRLFFIPLGVFWEVRIIILLFGLNKELIALIPEGMSFSPAVWALVWFLKPILEAWKTELMLAFQLTLLLYLVKAYSTLVLLQFP